MFFWGGTEFIDYKTSMATCSDPLRSGLTGPAPFERNRDGRLTSTRCCNLPSLKKLFHKVASNLVTPTYGILYGNVINYRTHPGRDRETSIEQKAKARLVWFEWFDTFYCREDKEHL